MVYLREFRNYMGSISLYLVGNLKAWACVWGLLRVSFSGLYLRCLGFRQDLGVDLYRRRSQGLLG